MKTLKEYADFLLEKGYKENFAPYTFLDGHLEIVEFIKDGYHINLYVVDTEEFHKYFESLEPGTEYDVKYENYIVNSAFIEAPICNVGNFYDGSTNGIELSLEPTTYNRHTLDLFEQCIGFQKINLLEHELFIMSRRQEHLTWAKENFVPLLEKYDYVISFDTFFDTKNKTPSSNQRISFKHHNCSEIVFETDCITGQPIIWSDAAPEEKVVDLTDKLYGKNIDEVYNVLLKEVWKKAEDKFGYIYNNDPHETIDTFSEVGLLHDCLYYKEKKEINFDIIPKRYEYLINEYLKKENKL